MQIHNLAGDTPTYLNGAFLRADEVMISPFDRGFLFGDGIYEVVPVYQGKPFRIQNHLDRLDRSLAAIRIANPHDRAAWLALVGQLIERSPTRDCMVYLQITRGVAKRDHAFTPASVAPTVFGAVTSLPRPTPAQREQGLSTISHPDERWLHCEIKSVSLLGSVLAKQAAVEAGVDEVIQFRDGNLSEGASSNIWVVKGGRLLAPIKNHLILEGIRYGFLQELAAEAGVPFEARNITRAEVESADELLLTSATKEVLAITKHDSKPVGFGAHAGRPGPVYAKLRAGYDRRLQEL